MARDHMGRRPGRRLAEAAADAALSRRGDLCPECGERENIQDNGAKDDERAFLCEECHCQWDALFGKVDQEG